MLRRENGLRINFNDAIIIGGGFLVVLCVCAFGVAYTGTRYKRLQEEMEKEAERRNSIQLSNQPPARAAKYQEPESGDQFVPMSEDISHVKGQVPEEQKEEVLEVTPDPN